MLLRGRGYSELTRSGVVVRATDYSRTVQSAAALLYGLAGQNTDLIDSADVELTRDAYLCLDKHRSSSSSKTLNVTCGCRAALTVLARRQRLNRTKDADERQLRTDIASVLNVTVSRLPWTAAVLEVPPVSALHIYHYSLLRQ